MVGPSGDPGEIALGPEDFGEDLGGVAHHTDRQRPSCLHRSEDPLDCVVEVVGQFVEVAGFDAPLRTGVGERSARGDQRPYPVPLDRPDRHPSWLSSIREGLAYVWGHPELRATLVLVTFVSILAIFDSKLSLA